MSVLGIDAGTTGCKGLLLGQGMHRFAMPRYDYALEFPRPRWVELDARRVLEAARLVIAATAPGWGDPVRAVAVSSIWRRPRVTNADAGSEMVLET